MPSTTVSTPKTSVDFHCVTSGAGGRIVVWGRGGSTALVSARRAFPAETGACCVGASEALSAGSNRARCPTWTGRRSLDAHQVRQRGSLPQRLDEEARQCECAAT